MSSDHVHNWFVIETRALPDEPPDSDVTFKVERCSWCGEHREYRDSGSYDIV